MLLQVELDTVEVAELPNPVVGFENSIFLALDLIAVPSPSDLVLGLVAAVPSLPDLVLGLVAALQSLPDLALDLVAAVPSLPGLVASLLLVGMVESFA